MTALEVQYEEQHHEEIKSQLPRLILKSKVTQPRLSHFGFLPSSPG